MVYSIKIGQGASRKAKKGVGKKKKEESKE